MDSSRAPAKLGQAKRIKRRRSPWQLESGNGKEPLKRVLLRLRLIHARLAKTNYKPKDSPMIIMLSVCLRSKQGRGQRAEGRGQKAEYARQAAVVFKLFHYLHEYSNALQLKLS